MTLSATDGGVRGLGYVTWVCIFVATCTVSLNYRTHTFSMESNWRFILAEVAGKRYRRHLYEKMSNSFAYTLK